MAGQWSRKNTGFWGVFMDLGEWIDQIQLTTDLDSLTKVMQRIIEHFGFTSWCMVDAGRAYADVPFNFGTTGATWVNHYKSNGFVHIDPYIAKARRENTPFDWSSIPNPLTKRGPKSKFKFLMESAYDNGFKEGLIFPCHFNDRIGRRHSVVCVFYWTSEESEFRTKIPEIRIYLHMIVIYFITHSMELLALSVRDNVSLFKTPSDVFERRLTDRERDVISWAARGKTAFETAEILGLSKDTVEKHISNVVSKIDARNRTHAVAKCIHLSLIDL
ncbi:MAG: LuxR family transcriptional regulator [Proteobacteria bacterium]|nr:LuxR family transcriptional regulator [Pseudomonadota bacterium]